MKIVSVKFNNYYRSYAFNTRLPLKEGKVYRIRADGLEYSTPVKVEKYLDKGPVGITLKEIDNAVEVEEEN